MGALLPPRNGPTLPRPSTLIRPTRRATHRGSNGCHYQSRRYPHRNERSTTKSRRRRRTRPRQSTNEHGRGNTTINRIIPNIKQRPRLKRRLPRRLFLPKTMSRGQRLQTTTTYRRRRQPTLRRPNSKKSTSIHMTCLTTPRPRLRPKRPTTPTTRLINDIPSHVVSNLSGATNRASTRRRPNRRRRPHHANKRPINYRPSRRIRPKRNCHLNNRKG